MEKSKKVVYSLLVLLLLSGSIFYFSNDEKNKNLESKPKSIELKTETISEVQKEKVIEKTEIKKIKKTVKNNSNSSEVVVYKNSPENEGINMVLNVPEKWSHLDYSKLGQPEEVALKPEEYPVEPKDYYIKTDGKVFHFDYLDAETEKKFLELYLNEDFRDLISKFYDDKKMQSVHDHYVDIHESDDEWYQIPEYVVVEDFLSDINNLIYIDTETGRKETNGIHKIFAYFCSRTNRPIGLGCYSSYDKLGLDDPVKESLTKKEFLEFKSYMDYYNNMMSCDYRKSNFSCDKTNTIKK